MLLKVCLVLAATLSLVSCLNVGYLLQNARKEGIQVMNIVETGADDTVKTVEKGAVNTVKTVEKGAVNTVKTVGKGAVDTVKTVEKGAVDTVKTVEKGAGDTVKTVEKGAGDTVKTIEKGADNTEKTVEKGAGDTVKKVEKGAGDIVNTVGKEGAQTMNIIEKGVADTVKTAEDVVKLLETVKGNSSCACVNYTCGCCLQLVVEKIYLNETGCLNISYLPDEYGFQLVFTLNGQVIINEKISVKNPPPICATIPYIHQLASLCIRFYNLDYKAKQFSGCADIEIEVERLVVKKYDLGCIHIPPSYGHFLPKVTSQ